MSDLFVCNRCGGELEFVQHVEKIEVWKISPKTGQLLSITDQEFIKNYGQSVYCVKCDNIYKSLIVAESPMNDIFECSGDEIVTKGHKDE